MARRTKPNDATPDDTLAARFLRSAQRCRARDLELLSVLSGLARGVSELIHALQKERGASSIYLGSNGAHFADRLAARVVESRGLEEQVGGQLERMDTMLDPLLCSARFYAQVGYALRALETLPGTREQVSALELAPQDAMKIFTDVIALLLAVGFEAADTAADPETSRALIALVNFAQGKEYAGQDRAIAGGALSRGHFSAAERSRLRQLEGAQQRAFKVFSKFADPRHVTLLLELGGSAETAQFLELRATALEEAPGDEVPAVSADAWYEAATRRIDAMRVIEQALAADLGRLCDLRLADAKAGATGRQALESDLPNRTPPRAMLITDPQPDVDGRAMSGGLGLYGMEEGLPKPMRSILDVVEAQSRRIEDINSQLESARVALAERKTIDRAKGILMHSRRLNEKDAYTLLRQTAMSQNRRIFEVAEAVISMADILKP